MKQPSKRGFTLVELLLVMGIMGILFGVLSEVFGAVILMRLKNEATSGLAQDTRYLLARLSQDVTRASSISVTAPSTLVLTIAGQTYTYSLVNEMLELTVDGGGAVSLTGSGTKVTGASFTELDTLGGKESVALDLTLESAVALPGGAVGTRRLVTTLGER